MTSIDYKTGGYSIPANKQQSFTFWWGNGSHAPNEYFDVFISPELPSNQPGMQGLVEVSRNIYFSRDVTQPQPVLQLTLNNPNYFEVKFIANHVRIYSGGSSSTRGGGGPPGPTDPSPT